MTFDPQQEETTATSSSLDAQEFNSLCPIAPVMSISPPPPLMPVALRWIMVGVIEMAAAPREEEEEEDYPRLNMFHVKLLFTSASKCNYHYIIYGPIYGPINAMLGPLLRNKASFLSLLLIEIKAGVSFSGRRPDRSRLESGGNLSWPDRRCHGSSPARLCARLAASAR